MHRPGQVNDPYVYYGTNSIGSVTALSDGAGALLEEYEYRPFGEETIFDNQQVAQAGTQFGNPYRFTGRRKDYEESSPLYYYRTRYYSPETGRFISHDSIGDWGSAINKGNGQAYAGNNPVNYRDPFGEDVWWETPTDPWSWEDTFTYGFTRFLKGVRVGASRCPKPSKPSKPTTTEDEEAQPMPSMPLNPIGFSEDTGTLTECSPDEFKDALEGTKGVIRYFIYAVELYLFLDALRNTLKWLDSMGLGLGMGKNPGKVGGGGKGARKGNSGKGKAQSKGNKGKRKGEDIKRGEGGSKKHDPGGGHNAKSQKTVKKNFQKKQLNKKQQELADYHEKKTKWDKLDKFIKKTCDELHPGSPPKGYDPSDFSGE